MNPNSEQIIADLAAQLGVAANHVYAVLVQQTAVEGRVYAMASGLMFLLSLVITGVMLWGAYRAFKNPDSQWEPVGAMIALFAIVPALCALLFGNELIGNLLKMQNPEYYAIRHVLGVVSGAK